MGKIVLIIAVVFFSLAFAAYAQMPEAPAAYATRPINLGTEPQAAFLESVNADKAIYDNCPISKGGDGALNTVAAWVDVPKEINKETQQNNIFSGLTVGFGKGLVTGITRGIAGAVDIVTCGLPPYNEPLMKPEYKVANPDKDGLKVSILQW
ncbi:MAG: exosortase system-associated protein, TIGR04073 family [Candidatus Omnitrophica bacterium]|nr:exosortase system-associated protein, TIGR04073 family [Candidatus Omnitrophota bacterium]